MLLADSDYRHEIMADIAPFEGLLLGLFFTAIGMSLNLALIAENPYLVAAIVAGLLADQERRPVRPGPPHRPGARARRAGSRSRCRRAASSPSRCSRPGAQVGVLDRPIADLLSVAVTLSMAATPLLLLIDELLAPKAGPVRAFDEMPDNDGHVVIAGFGRVGQIVARILSAKRIPVTALDFNAEQVDFVRKFGAQIYYGDASRPEILEAAQTGKARAFVLAVDDMEASAEHRPRGAAATIPTCRSMRAPATAATCTG